MIIEVYLVIQYYINLVILFIFKLSSMRLDQLMSNNFIPFPLLFIPSMGISDSIPTIIRFIDSLHFYLILSIHANQCF